MTKKNYTHITLVVDRSGSMDFIKKDAQGGINQLIAAHKAADGQCTFALYQFDTQFETVFGPGNISLLESYTLVPRGGTALYDAQWKAIHSTGDYLRSLPESQRPEKVIFVTVTDGGENASSEISGPSGLATLKSKVQEQESKYSWEFIYIGANQDAFDVGSSFGVTRNMGYVANAASTTSMYNNLIGSTLSARSTGADTASFLASQVDAEGNVITNNTTATTGESQ